MKRSAKIMMTIALGTTTFSSNLTKSPQTMFTWGKQLFAKAPHFDENPPIHLIVSAIWEGRSMRPHNISAMQKFRRDFSGIGVIHFVSPAYFAQGEKQAKKAKQMLASSVNAADEFGMLLSPWKSLTDRAQIVFRMAPTFWGSALDEADCDQDCGSEVPLSVYRRDEVVRLIRTGQKLFQEQDLPVPINFLADGGMASPAVLEAAAATGFKYDYSAIHADSQSHQIRNYPLYQWLKELWPDFTPHTQPFEIKTKRGRIMEIGTNAAILDSQATDSIRDNFKTYVSKRKNNPGLPLTFHISFHQETAYKYLPRLTASLREIFKEAERQKIQLVPITLPANKFRLASSHH